MSSQDERITDAINALKRTNMSTFQIAEIYHLSHDTVCELMNNLDYSEV